MEQAPPPSSPACPICASAAAPFISVDARPLSICTRCRHIFWRDMPTEAELGQYYGGSYASSHDQMAIQTANRSYYRQHAADLAVKSGKERGVVLLDYGCAWPVMLEEAKSVPAFSRLIGVDYEKAARDHGATLGLDMFSPTEVVERLDEKSVDILRFSHVIEHMRDPMTTLRDLAKLLKDDGLVYITQPIFPALSLRARPPGLKDAVYPEHLHFFTAASLNLTVDAMGADISEIAAFQKEEEIEAMFDAGMDRAHAETINAPLKSLTPRGFHKLGGYPTFIGENVYLYGRKRARPAASQPAAASSVTRSLRRRVAKLIKRWVPRRTA